MTRQPHVVDPHSKTRKAISPLLISSRSNGCSRPLDTTTCSVLEIESSWKPASTGSRQRTVASIAEDLSCGSTRDCGRQGRKDTGALGSHATAAILAYLELLNKDSRALPMKTGSPAPCLSPNTAVDFPPDRLVPKYLEEQDWTLRSVLTPLDTVR